MTTVVDVQRIHYLLDEFFGDEGLQFHSKRMNDFFAATFVDPMEDNKLNISRLLYTQNDLLRLLDAAYLLRTNLKPLLVIPGHKVLEQVRNIRAMLDDWDDFPTHLRMLEWYKPELVLQECFELQTIDEWKDALQGLLQSVIRCDSLFERLSEVQGGFIVLTFNRLLDAVWLLRVCGRILPLDEEETFGDNSGTEAEKDAV